MAKRHTGLDNTAMPKSGKQPGNFPRGGLGHSKTPAGRSKAPFQPSGEVSRQRSSSGGSRTSSPSSFERGYNPMPSPRAKARGSLPSEGLSLADTDMPRPGHQSATAPGALARPGSERGSATMDARSSVPVSIQEACGAGDTRDRFGTLESGDSDNREDNAEIDAGVGTGRAARGTFRGNRRY